MVEEGELEDGELVPSAVGELVCGGQTEQDDNKCEPVKAAPYLYRVLHFDPPPQRILHLHQQFKNSKGLANNFLKGAKWSPDGSCFLTCSEDKCIRLFDLPANYPEDELSGMECDAPSASSNKDASLTVVEGEIVYDFCWYPYMTATDPATCVFVTTTRDHPIHLWDAATGKLRCTYRAYNAVDEITAALSLQFNPLGSRLFCGYNKMIRVFDVSIPGRNCEEHSTTTKTKEGIAGIVSSLAFNNHHTGLLAAGSYDRRVALFNEGNMELLYVLHGHEGGVTQVQFSKDGNYLYSGGRRDRFILCWDVRYTASLVYKLERVAADTNQRISFDIEPYGQHLGTGGEDGKVRFYNLRTGDIVGNVQAAADTVNGFSFHPSEALAVSASGERRFTACDEQDNPVLTELMNCASVWSFKHSTEEYRG